MYPVSNDYKSQIEKQVRNFSYIKVNFGIVDSNASEDSTITDNGSMYYSQSNEIDLGKNVELRYLTFEHNKFILDGFNRLPEVGEVEYYQGFVSNAISNSSGQFTTPPKITITFPSLFSFIGLTFRFNKLQNSYPSELRVRAYNGASVVYDSIKTPTSPEYVLDEPVPASGLFCNKIELTFNKTYPVRRRAELEYLMFGIVKTFTNEEISSSMWTRELSLMSTRLPKNEFTFSILDKNKDYNPENPQGVWQYLEERQPVWFQYGYQLDNGQIEWVDASTLYSVGKVKVSSGSITPVVSFSTESILNSLEETYYQGVYYPAGRSLYDLAIDVLTFANLPLLRNGTIPYVVDTALQSVITRVPLPEMKIKEVLQLIANAGRCVIDCNRIGQIEIKRYVEPVVNSSTFKFTFDKIKLPPVLEKNQLLLSVNTFSNTVTVEDNSTILHTSNVTLDTPTECLFKYDMSTNVSLNAGVGITVHDTPTYYAGSCRVTISGSGTINITGKKLIFSKDGISYVVGTTGFICPIENLLLNSSADAYAYAEWVASILVRRNEYKIQDRGYPELDTGDLILSDTLFTSDMEATIVGLKVKYNGALSGETKFLSKEVLR